MKKYLIVGLGNIGAAYKNTRHNIGFKVLDQLASTQDLQFETVRLGSRANLKYKGRLFILLKPSTMMNLSGNAVRYWMQKEKIALENLLIISDDLNISFGTIRLKGHGSAGGHNGLKDIEQKIGTNQYSRFRFGIGNNYQKGNQINFVISEWSPEEEKALKERLEKATDLVLSFGTIGLERTMNFFNGQ